MPTTYQLLKGVRSGKIRRPRLLALEGAPIRKGVVYKVDTMTPRKPNSAKRKIVKIRLTYNGRRVFANIPGIGHKLREYSVVIVRGGSAKDLPGVNYALIRGAKDFTIREQFERRNRRSKFGVKKR